MNVHSAQHWVNDGCELSYIPDMDRVRAEGITKIHASCTPRVRASRQRWNSCAIPSRGRPMSTWVSRPRGGRSRSDGLGPPGGCEQLAVTTARRHTTTDEGRQIAV